MKKALSLILSIQMVFVISGCASMFSGTTQTILVRSDTRGTKFFYNEQEIGTDSATVQISKKNLPNAIIVARKPGCTDAQTLIPTKFDPTALLGILIDLGIVSILVVDWGITGAVHEAERTNFVLNPGCGQ